MEFGRVVKNTAYMIPYGFYIRAMFYNKKLFEQAGLDGPPQTMDDFMEDVEEDQRHRRQVRLLPARQQGRLQRLVHVHGQHERQERLVRQGRHQHLQQARAR